MDKKLFFSALLLTTVFSHQTVQGFPALENGPLLVGGLSVAAGSYMYSNYLEHKDGGKEETSIVSRACRTTDRGVSGATTLLALTASAAAFEGMEGPVTYTSAALLLPYFWNRLTTPKDKLIDMAPTIERAAGVGLLSLACNSNEIVRNAVFAPVAIAAALLSPK